MTKLKSSSTESSIIRSRSYSYDGSSFDDDDDDDDDSRSGIKFTRKFTQQYKSCCCVLLSLSVTLLSACVVLFCAYYYVKLEPGEELVFQGSFTILYNDSDTNSVSNSTTDADYNKEINAYIKSLQKSLQLRPIIRLSLVSADIHNVDKIEDENRATVFFELKFNPRLLFGTDLSNLVNILKQNLRVPSGVIDASNFSLREVHSSWMMSSSSLIPNIPAYSHMLDDNFSNTPGKCVPAIQLPFCPHVFNNLTSYPNIFMHRNAEDVREDLVSFRELIDGECFSYAAEFLCHVLQPTCVQKEYSSIDETFLPCSEFCKEFVQACGGRFSEKLKRNFDCLKFPEYSQRGRNCRKQPNCNAATLNPNDPFSYRFCDGVIDCLNLEDELSCDYCSSNGGGIHCGITKNCIAKTSFCNNIPDCPDGSDEKSCLSLWPNTSSNYDMKTTRDFLHHKEGFVVFSQEGASGLLCVEKEKADETLLESMAQAICKNTSYQDVNQMQIRPISQDNDSLIINMYAQFSEDWLSSKMQLSLTSNCSSGHALYVSCTQSECGTQPTRLDANSLDGLNKVSTAGDWPWHVALFKNAVHSCDATLLSESWLITSISCFQGQNKAEWVAKLGAVRLYGKSPWQQERHIVGMLKSPVEGSTLVLLKLSSPVIYSNFVRPVCLPFNSAASEELIYCNALGWNESKGVLQRIEISQTAMDNCEDMSIMIHNGLCAASTYVIDECDDVEMAGSPMVCLTSRQNRWVLIGVSNWRISCSPIGMQRPRLYDKVVSNVNWIRNIIKQF